MNPKPTLLGFGANRQERTAKPALKLSLSMQETFPQVLRATDSVINIMLSCGINKGVTMRNLVTAIVFSAGLSCATTVQAEELNLVCFGAGSANKVTGSSAYGWDNSGNSANAMVYSQRSQGFEDEVRLRINDDDPRLRMPHTMLPKIRGGEDGWFKMKDIEYSEGEITASIAVSLLNNPNMRLDRYTGSISISGKSGDYVGQCQKFDPEQVERKF